MKTSFSKLWSRKADSAAHRSTELAQRRTPDADLSDIPTGEQAVHLPLQFRPITLGDLNEVMAIEKSAYTFPWSTGFFRQELQTACARSILVESDGRIIAYVLFWVLPGAIDVHNIAVHPDYQRRGIARLLLDRVISEARRQSAIRVMLEVRQSNTAAQKLYESTGFAITGIRKAYYSDNGEDALAMTLELPGPE